MLSKAMNAAMHSAAEGRSTTGIPKSVGAKFVAHSHGQKVGSLPEHVARRKAKRAERGGKGVVSSDADAA